MTMRQSSERGDTLVEVLIAVAILGVVLSSVSVIINRSIKTNLASQERLTAMKIAERQQELFRVASSDAAMMSKIGLGPFCMAITGSGASTATEVIASGDARCRVDAVGTATTAIPNYKIDIRTAAASIDGATPPIAGVTGRRIHVQISWDSALGSGTERLDSYTEVYSNG